MNLLDRVEERFKELFKEQPLLIRSPGRVNLLGEHTDYNMGYVLPAAIDKAIYFAITARKDETCRVVSLDMNDSHEFTVGALQPTTKGWPNYLMGVVDQLVKGGYAVGGFDCVFGGDIPMGAGLSSSAALEAGLAFALNHMFELGIESLALVKLAQKAENEFVGVQCGIMDQYINIFGEQNNVLRIDCRSLESDCHPFDHNVAIVLFDTGVSHSLASSQYNRRREECGEGVALIQKSYPQVTHLRDVSAGMLHEHRQHMDATIYRRCRYVVGENDRVLQACAVLEKSDLKAFGDLMYTTHDGLSHDYEVSCPELDYLVDAVRNHPEVFGARMMGGGFGGCTINLIKRDAVAEIKALVTRSYAQRFNLEAKTYETSIASGTSLIGVAENARG
jgi:galactokinase